MAPLCVPNLCRAVLRVPLRGAISQELPSLTRYLSFFISSVCFSVASLLPLPVQSYSPRYTDLTASSLSAFLPLGRVSTCHRVVPAFFEFQKIIVIARGEERDESRRLPVCTRVLSERRIRMYPVRCIADLMNSLDNLLSRRFRSISRREVSLRRAL